MKEIIIGAKDSIISCMRKALNRYDVKYSNIGWEDSVPSKEQIKIPILFDIDVKKELTCMNACISSSTAIYGDGFFEDFT